MSKLNFKNEGDEHNFWQNYTDLMSGFLVVFIITSLVAWYGYIKVTGAIGGDGGSIKVTIEQSRMIREFNEAQKSLVSEYFHYNEQYQRFECKSDIMFEPNLANIPADKEEIFIEAGKELVNKILSKFKESEFFLAWSIGISTLTTKTRTRNKHFSIHFLNGFNYPILIPKII